VNLTIDPNCFNFCVKWNERHVRFSKCSFIKRLRKLRGARSIKKEVDEKNLNLEQLYGAGIAE